MKKLLLAVCLSMVVSLCLIVISVGTVFVANNFPSYVPFIVFPLFFLYLVYEIYRTL